MTPTSGLCVALRTARHLYVLAGCPSYQPQSTACSPHCLPLLLLLCRKRARCATCTAQRRAALPLASSGCWTASAWKHTCAWSQVPLAALGCGCCACIGAAWFEAVFCACHASCRSACGALQRDLPSVAGHAPQLWHQSHPTDQPTCTAGLCPLRAAAERLFPWLLDWIADSSALPAAEALSQLRKIAHQLLVSGRLVGQLGVVLSVACRCKCTDGPARHSTAGAAAGRSCYSAHSHVLGAFVIKRHTCLGLMHLLQPKASISARCALCRWRLLSCTTAAW